MESANRVDGVRRFQGVPEPPPGEILEAMHEPLEWVRSDESLLLAFGGVISPSPVG